MSIASEIETELGPLWIPRIYLEKVKPIRTRAFNLGVPAKENRVDLVHTLLGIQLKTGKQLIGCPDLSTARYLRVFARIGCDDVAIPYDITKISSIADELDSAWHTMILLLEQDSVNKSARSAGIRRGGVVKALRTQINTAGAGDLMPAFDKETRQRKR